MTFAKYKDESRPLFLSLKLLNVYELYIYIYTHLIAIRLS